MATAQAAITPAGSLDGAYGDWARKVRALAAQRDAVILAHTYQVPWIQEVADFVGDSLELSRRAAATSAAVIVFCGVHFMAETAKVLCPDRTVLIPDRDAGCSLAETITAAQLRAWKAEHPGAVVVAYVNTSAEVKAESDYCCTSANAVQVVESIPRDREVLFLPDMFLAAHVERETGRKLEVWMGECHVHAALTPADVESKRRQYPDAEFLVHPECGCTTSAMYYAAAEDDSVAGRTHIVSTEQMMQRARTSTRHRFVVATETGVLHRLRRENSDKAFYALNDSAECRFMKRITLEKVRDSLRDLKYDVSVPTETAARARRAIDRMLAIG